MKLENGKKSDMSDNPLWVVAGALKAAEDKWLMHRRPFEKQHGGIWEFPGGKVEAAEMPVEALMRELSEELGVTIAPEHCLPAAFAEEYSQSAGRHIVILLYTIEKWAGEPQSLEGGRIGWFSSEEIENLAKLPLDCDLAGQLFKKP